MDWMNDDGEGGEEGGMDGLDDGMDGLDDGMDELDDGMDGLDGDAGGFDEDDGFGDGLGDGFGDDGLDDDFGGDAGSNRVAELEDRIGEMENQVSSLSSDMNTVRQENIQIGDTVEELDDTIRKLLDIYEMVTRGINPFVDDAREMGGIDGGSGAFGLFDAEEEAESERLDNDVAAADADSFFDDDLGELDAEAGEQEAEIAAEDELSEEERDAAPGLEDDADDDDEDEGDGGGASFDDLKAEYESGDAEWSDDADAEAGEREAETLDDAAETDGDEVSGDVGETPTDAADPPDDAESPDGTSPDADGDDASEAMDAGNDVTASATAAEATEGGHGDVDEGEDAFLASLPPSYVAETLLLEWADYLVDEGGARNAVRAVRQYREFGWLSTRAADDFEAYVVGAADASSPARGDVLTVDHHATSLSYVVRLAGDSPAPELEPRFEDDLTAVFGGEGSGIRG